MKNKQSVLAVSLASLMLLSVASPAFASERAERAGDDNDNNRSEMMRGTEVEHGMRGEDRGGKAMFGAVAFGNVSAISGNTLTITGRLTGVANSTSTSITVDATNAKVLKAGATSTLSNIAVGDNVTVKGAVTGTNVVATEVHDGVMGEMMRGRGEGMGMDKNKNGLGFSEMMGNGQPIVAGAVTSVTGNTFVIKNSSNVTYTIDATNAKIFDGRATSTIASIAVGDNVVIQGAVNGSNVTASLVHEQKQPAVSNSNSNSGEKEKKGRGFFGGIGSFFGRLFGF